MIPWQPDCPIVCVYVCVFKRTERFSLTTLILVHTFLHVPYIVLLLAVQVNSTLYTVLHVFYTMHVRVPFLTLVFIYTSTNFYCETFKFKTCAKGVRQR